MRYCADHGYEVVGSFTDAHTGTELDRPGLNDAIDAVRTLRPAVVVLHDVDRLGREQIVQALAERDLSRHGARIEYVLGGGSGSSGQELLKMMKQAIAVYENRQRVERTRRGKDGRVRAGHPLVAARPAYGYCYIGGDRQGRLEPDPDEAPVVRQIFRWIVDDHLTCYEVAKRLHAAAIPTRGDRNTVVAKKAERHFWDPHTVARIVGNPIHKGEWYWNKTRRVPKEGDPEKKVQRLRPREEWLTLPVEPIVEAERWEQAQLRLARNKQQARRNTKRDYLLRGLVFCPCGRRWTGRYKNHLQRAYYRCPITESEPWRGECHSRFGIEQTKLETAVLDTVKAFLLDEEVRRTALSAERIRAQAERERLGEDLATIDQHLTRVEKQLGKLLDSLLIDDFPTDVVAARKRELLAERGRLAAERERRLAELDPPAVDVEATIAAMAPIVEQAFSLGTTTELRQLLDLLRIEVYVVDRTNIRLTGVLGSVVAHLPTQKRHNGPIPFNLPISLRPSRLVA